ncbi:MAG TPA: SH3 domain-containing protein [Thermomicrobiales bacterium]|nr:SH3 domain-containing protein [Thermomicrobiales bacterium]
MGNICQHTHSAATSSIASLMSSSLGRRAILKATAAFSAMAATASMARPQASAQGTPTAAGEWHQPSEVGGSGGTLGFKADIPFYAIAPHWPGDVDFPAAVEVQVSNDNETFTDPVLVGPAHTDAGPPDKDGRTYGQLMFTEQAQYVKYRTLDADGKERGIPGLSFTYIDATGGPTIDDIAPSTANPSLSRPPIISREEWGSSLAYGGAERAASEWPPQYQTVEHIIIHHSETPSFRDPLAEIRSIHYYHAVTRGWGDIGYNYLVDFMGNVYEGRVGGENVVGGHAYQYAYGSAGICTMGSYKTEGATPEALAGLVWISAWAGRNLDPLGKSDFHEKANLPTICGHRDVNDSTCPGDGLYADLKYIRGAVAEVLAGARETIPDPEYSPGQIVATTGEGVNLRDLPGLDTDIKTEVPFGSVFQVIEGPTTVDGHHWYHLSGDAGDGWMSTSTFAPSDAAPPAGRFAAGDKVVVDTDMINLRDKPSLRSIIVASVARMAEGTVTEGPMPANGYAWYRIETDAGSGWAAEQYLALPGEAAPPVRFVVGDAVEVADPEGIKLRTAANTTAKVIASLPTGTRGAVIDGPRTANGLAWMQIQTALGTGWSAEKYLDAAPYADPPPAKFGRGDIVVVDTDALNLRASAGVAGEIVATLGAGAVAEIIDPPDAADNLNWYRLQSDAGTGWAVETFLAKQGAETGGRQFAVGDQVYVTTDALNLRETAGPDGDVLGVLYTNEGGVVIDGPESADGMVWYRVESSAGTGWSAAQYLGKGSADPAGQNRIKVGDLVAIDTDGINVRSGAGLDNEMVIIMLTGEEAEVVAGPTDADGYTWYKLSSPRGEGWGVAQYLKVMSAGSYAAGDDVKVIDGELNLRAAPGMGADVITIMPDAAWVEVIEGPDDADGHSWYRVSSSRYGAGWSAGEYLARA